MKQEIKPKLQFFFYSLQASIKTNTCLVFINMLNNNPNVVAM